MNTDEPEAYVIGWQPFLGLKIYLDFVRSHSTHRNRMVDRVQFLKELSRRREVIGGSKDLA